MIQPPNLEEWQTMEGMIRLRRHLDRLVRRTARVFILGLIRAPLPTL